MVEDLIFAGFNSRVVAMRRETGEVVWEWKSSEGKGYVTVMLDGDLLIVSVMGYMYCLEAETGRQVWFNGLSGRGLGVATLASVRGGMVGANAEMAAHETAKASE